MQLRKLASTAIGALLAGSSFAVPALASTLEDLPAPFVEGGEANFVVVVGAAADTADVVGAIDIAARFGGETVTTEAAERGKGQEDVILGMELSDKFGTTVDDDDVGVLQDTTITFDGEDWDVHDEIKLGSSSPSLQTSLSSNEEDYKADPVMEITAKGDVGYYYLFDEAINLSKRVTSDTPLEVSFLGQTLEIVSVSDSDTIKARVGQKVELDAGESVTIEGKTVKLIQTSSSSARVEVSGVSDVIDEGKTKTINGLEVKVDTIFDDEGATNDFAVLIVGKDAEETFDDDDEYIDYCTTGGDAECDKDNPDWVWDLGGLTTNAKGVTSGTSGPKIGVINDFVKDAATKKPQTVGQSLWLPHDFAQIELTEALADDFVKVTVEFSDAIDLNNTATAVAPGHLTWETSEDGFLVTADVDETLVLEDGAPAWRTDALSANVGTKKLAFVVNDFNVTGLNENASIDVFYWDANNKPIYAGNLTARTCGGACDKAVVLRFGYIDFKDTTGTGRIALSLNSTNTTADGTWLVFDDRDSELDGSDEDSDDIFIQMGTSAAIGRGGEGSGTAEFDALGTKSKEDEAGELLYGNVVGGSSTATIGTRDEDQLTLYGIKVGDPEQNGNSDRVTLWIPGDHQEIRVTIGAEAGAVAGDRTGQIKTAVAKLDTEVSAPAGEKNLILVGGPCANRLVAQLAADGKYPWACEDLGGLPAGGGYAIDIVNDAFATGQVALVVVGVSADDTRDAASRVQAFDVDGLGGTSVRTGVLAEA